MLLALDSIITPDELITLRNGLCRAQWESGLATAGTQAAVVKNNRQVAESSPGLGELRKVVLQALYRNPLFMSAALPVRILPPFFNSYTGSQNTYGWHVDNAMRATAEGYVRADVSATLFLSDPDSYEGGELVVQYTYGEQRVKLSAGHMVVNPSASVHQVTPVTKGERLACFMFIQSMVRDPGQRRLLFDLDMSLVQLRQSQGESAAPIVTLTGVYHNLLRRWAEP